MISDPVAITLIISALLIVLTLITRPRSKEIRRLIEIVHELIGLTPAVKAKWGMPEPEEILSELRRLKGDKQ